MTEPRRWRRLFRPPGSNVAAEVDDEFEFHIAMRAAEHERRGAGPDAARALARAEFGDAARARQQCEEIAERERRRLRWTELAGSFAADSRYALRALARAPAFAAVAVLTLALGIGANAAIFGVVHGVLLRPLPYAEPERLVRIWETSPRGERRNVVSAGNYAEWRSRATSFSAIGAHRWPYGVALAGDGEPIQLVTADVTPSVLGVLRVVPRAGRSLVADDARGDGRVAVISEGLWRRRFGAAPVIGRTVNLDGTPFTIVGVMPARFVFPEAGVDIWRPVGESEIDPNERRSHNWGVIARLRPEVPLEAARAEMSAIGAAVAREHPQFMTGWGVNTVALHDDLVADVRPLLLILLAGAGVVLLIACANIANLLLARALTREREMAVRGALGAGRGRLVRQLLTESAILAALGTALGVILATLLTRALVTLAPPDIPRLAEVGMAPAVFAYAAGAAAVATLLFGLVPAIRLARSAEGRERSLQQTLRTARDGGGVEQGRLRAALLVAEVALSVVLLVGAGLLLRSAARLNQVDFGFDAAGVLAVSLDLPRTRYDGSARQVAFYERLIERVSLLPGVAAVGGTTHTPALASSTTFSFAIQGRAASNPSGREDPEALRAVTPDYFRAMGIPLVRGRVFDAGDRAGAPPVVAVNEALARKLWPDGLAVGQRISFAGAQGPWLDVVGVVGDTRLTNADAPPAPAMYLPHAQKRWPWMSWFTLVVRAAPGTEPTVLVPAIRAALWELDGQLPIHRAAAVSDLYAESTARRRFATVLLGVFATLALLLGVIGIYGVLSYTVAQRRREIGIRIALGASSRRVVGDVMRRALTLAGVGLGAGIVLALLATRHLDTLLYEVPPTDPVTFVGVAVLLAGVTVVAAWLPARRATTIAPLTAMRDG